MNVQALSESQRTLRMNVRNLLVGATSREQVEKELELSKERGDSFRTQCVQEWLDEMDEDKV